MKTKTLKFQFTSIRGKDAQIAFVPWDIAITSYLAKKHRRRFNVKDIKSIPFHRQNIKASKQLKGNSTNSDIMICKNFHSNDIIDFRIYHKYFYIFIFKVSSMKCQIKLEIWNASFIVSARWCSDKNRLFMSSVENSVYFLLYFEIFYRFIFATSSFCKDSKFQPLVKNGSKQMRCAFT